MFCLRTEICPLADRIARPVVARHVFIRAQPDDSSQRGEHRAQPDVPQAGRGRRDLRQASHRIACQEVEGQEGRTGLVDYGNYDERQPAVEMCYHAENA